jgi:phosphatidylglycerol---prolipoprotein diacylglyceryl transferase
MLVGQAIGRLGCLSNGDAWGAPMTTPCGICLAIRYTNSNDLLPADLKGVPTYAYPAYEIVAELVLLAALWLFRDQLRKFPGASFLVSAIGYAVIRFGLTFLRQETIIIWGLQEAQVIALITGASALGVMAWRMSQMRWHFAT